MGPRIVATRSVFYPGTEQVMGWDIGGSGFRIVLAGPFATRFEHTLLQSPTEETPVNLDLLRLYATTGEIRFGDGNRGRIPIAGSEIVATEYRYGGGAAGNVTAHALNVLRSSIPYVRRASSFAS